jgi:hypothetical protein
VFNRKAWSQTNTRFRRPSNFQSWKIWKIREQYFINFVHRKYNKNLKFLWLNFCGLFHASWFFFSPTDLFHSWFWKFIEISLCQWNVSKKFIIKFVYYCHHASLVQYCLVSRTNRENPTKTHTIMDQRKRQ